jgi:hypothetical protein
MDSPLDAILPFLGAWGLYGIIGAVSRNQQQHYPPSRGSFILVDFWCAANNAFDIYLSSWRPYFRLFRSQEPSSTATKETFPFSS